MGTQARTAEEEARKDAEERARGALVLELLHASIRLADVATERAVTAEELDTIDVFERARRALVHGIGEAGELVSIRLSSSGRRPAVPCPGCGEPVRFKWASSETLCGDCQCES